MSQAVLGQGLRGEKEQDREAAGTRWVIVRLTGTLLGGALIVNAFLAEYFFDRGAEVSALSALLGAILLSTPILVRALRGMAGERVHTARLV